MEFARNYERLFAMMDIAGGIGAHRFSDAEKTRFLPKKYANTLVRIA